MSEMAFQYVLPATYDGLTRMNAALREHLGESKLSERSIYAVVLSAEELITNIVKYGFPDGQERGTIRLKLDYFPSELVLTIEDQGIPFDPLSHPAPETVEQLLEQPIGGLGIHLVRQMTRIMHYHRPGDVNRLTLHIDRRK